MIKPQWISFHWLGVVAVVVWFFGLGGFGVFSIMAAESTGVGFKQLNIILNAGKTKFSSL